MKLQNKLLINVKTYRETGKMAVNIRSSKPRRIHSFLQGDKFSKGELTVRYGPGLFNSAKFDSLIQGKRILRVFTEKSLLDFLEVK